MTLRFAIFPSAAAVLLGIANFAVAQTLLWDFQNVGPLPPGWENNWDLDGWCNDEPPDPQLCDSQKLPWQVRNVELSGVESGMLVAPSYDENDGSMDTYVDTAPFMSVADANATSDSSQDGSANGTVGDFFLTFQLFYDVTMMQSAGRDQLYTELWSGETLVAELIDELQLGDPQSFNDADEAEDGLVDGIINVSHPISAGVQYRLRIRARDDDTSVGTFRGIGYDNIRVTNGIAILPLLGDFDADNDVDGSDFLTWQQNSSTNPNSAADLANWQSDFGVGTGSSMTSAVAVPETSFAVYVVLSAAAVLSRRPIR